MKKTGNECLYCKKALYGRSDKKYCDRYCKSAYGYELRKIVAPLFFKIDRQLKINRRILRKYNREGKTIIDKSLLIKEGFNPQYFTHYWKNEKAKVYLFCFEYGFLSICESDSEKYLLEHWQDFME